MNLASSRFASRNQNATAGKSVSTVSLLREPKPRASKDLPLVVVLAVGFEPLLSEPRRSIQSSRGYIITAAESIQAAIAYIHEGDFDLVMLGRRLPLEDQQRLTFLIRSSGCLVPIICVTNAAGDSSGTSNMGIESHPEELLSGIADALAGIATKSPAVGQRRYL